MIRSRLYRQVIGLALILGLILAVTPGVETVAAQVPNRRGSIGVGALGTQWYIFATEISRIVQEEYDYRIDLAVRGTGGGAENQRLLGRGTMEFGFVLAPDVGAAYTGIGVYEGQAQDFAKVRGVFAYPYAGIQIVTLARDNIRTVKDLEGKRISVGAPGSGGATFINPIVLGAHGITENNSRFEYLTIPAGADQLRDGHLHAMIVQQMDPIAHVMDLALARDIYLVPLDPEAMEEIYGQIPGTYAHTLDPKMYGDRQMNEEPVLVLGYTSIFATHSDLPEDVVYYVTKALFENLEEFHKAHAGASVVRLETALQGMTVPLHPGAARYYREKGIDIPEHLLVD